MTSEYNGILFALIEPGLDFYLLFECLFWKLLKWDFSVCVRGFLFYIFFHLGLCMSKENPLPWALPVLLQQLCLYQSHLANLSNPSSFFCGDKAWLLVFINHSFHKVLLAACTVILNMNAVVLFSNISYNLFHFHLYHWATQDQSPKQCHPTSLKCVWAC